MRQLNVDVRPLAHVCFGIKGQGFDASNIPSHRSPGVGKFHAVNLAPIRRHERYLHANQMASSSAQAFSTRRPKRRQRRADQGIRAPKDVHSSVFFNRGLGSGEQLLLNAPGGLHRHPKRKCRLSGDDIGINTRNEAERNMPPTNQAARQ